MGKFDPLFFPGFTLRINLEQSRTFVSYMSQPLMLIGYWHNGILLNGFELCIVKSEKWSYPSIPLCVWNINKST